MLEQDYFTGFFSAESDSSSRRQRAAGERK